MSSRYIVTESRQMRLHCFFLPRSIDFLYATLRIDSPQRHFFHYIAGRFEGVIVYKGIHNIQTFQKSSRVWDLQFF